MVESSPSAEALRAQIAALSADLQRTQAAHGRAEAENHAKSALLATVSHELRTPMGAIISMADLLLATNLEGTQRRYAETLQHSAQGLLTVLNDILDYSKLEAGQFELEAVAFDVQELLRDVMAGLDARAQEKDLVASLEIAPNCPTSVVGDPDRLRQILNNLTDNALKYTEAGGVRIRARALGSDDDMRLRIDVIDTGIGMSEEHKARIFRPYGQADRSVARKYGGTGLGLSIARRLAETMGGSMDCESAEGRGSIFWFTVRARPASPADTNTGSGPGRSQNRLAGHVLIVEDNAVNQMLIKAYVDRFGLTHESVDNGMDAILSVASGSFDAVLMDIMMPEMDGIETTRHIRALDEPASKIPIIALTANAMQGDRETYLAAGMDGYVSKPINADELIQALAEHLTAENAPVYANG